jgi:hypothetical protein
MDAYKKVFAAFVPPPAKQSTREGLTYLQCCEAFNKVMAKELETNQSSLQKKSLSNKRG